jgi:predicted nucleic acid-binding protein
VHWLLDTNVVSEGIRIRPSPKVIGWLSSRPRNDLAISTVTLAELRDGASTAIDEARRAALMRWIDTDVVPFFSERTIPLTVDILTDWIALSRWSRAKRKSRDAADILIAATARVYELTIVSRNSRDFAGTGVVVYDPWTDRTHRMDPP